MTGQTPKNQMQTRRNEFLEDVFAQVVVVLVDCGIDQSVADSVGTILINHLATHWGGQNFTIPMDHHARVSERNESIYREFNGRNHHVLASKYKLTVRGIYKIIQQHRNKAQIPLF